MFKCCFKIFKSKKNELLSFSDHIVGLKLLSKCIPAIKMLQLSSQPLEFFIKLEEWQVGSLCNCYPREIQLSHSKV